MQVSAGAVALTDCVFWLILYPFLTAKDYSLNFVSIESNVGLRMELSYASVKLNLFVF